jgi:hypothetical protein
MPKTSKFIDKPIANCQFIFQCYLKFKVKVKEVIKSHNQELGWKLSESTDRSDHGDRFVTFVLSGKESLRDVPEKRQLITGLLEDIHQVTGVPISNELAQKYNTCTMSIGAGTDFHLKNVKLAPKKIYLSFEYLDYQFTLVAELAKIVEIEREYPKVVKKAFGQTVKSWHSQNLKDSKKILISRNLKKIAKSIVELLEKDATAKKYFSE